MTNFLKYDVVKEFIISKLGRLDEEDSKKLEKMIEVMC